MITPMATQARGERPPHTRGTQERDRHLEQTRGYRFLAGRGPKPSATVRPAPLRYWQYDPPGRTAILFILVVVSVWLGVFVWLVSVRHLADDGRTDRSFTHWVRDPQAFATALGRRLA